MARIWHPRAWGADGLAANHKIFFCLSATHRGDMYHVRAAMITEALQGKRIYLILYDCGAEGTQSLEDYLSEFCQNRGHTFKVPWTRQELFDQQPPPNLPNRRRCTLDGHDTQQSDLQFQHLDSLGEAAATRKFAKFIADSPGRLIEVAPFMVGSDAAHPSEQQRTFDTFFESPIWQQKDPFKKLNVQGSAILIMHRATGTVTNGAYPEFDTGEGLEQLCEIIQSLRDPKHPETRFFPIVVGDYSNPKWKSLGAYWELLKEHRQGVSARAAEAAYLSWAHRKRYFQMAIGLRSGVLDLYTFLGIPSVSIGLDKMVGEPRHSSLAGQVYQRYNVQYEKPRQMATALVTSTRNPHAPLLYHSPWWDDAADKDKPNEADRKNISTSNPGRWDDIDSRIIEVGIYLALTRFLGGTHDSYLREAGQLGYVLNGKDLKKIWRPLSAKDGEDDLSAEQRAQEEWRTKVDKEKGKHLDALQKMSGSLRETQRIVDDRIVLWNQPWAF